MLGPAAAGAALEVVLGHRPGGDRDRRRRRPSSRTTTILPMHRNLGVFTGRDLDLPQLFRQLLGREGGFTKGRDRTFHFGTLEKGIVGMISHLGAMLPVADGLALAAQLRGRARAWPRRSPATAATSEGDFHEALNLAAVWKLPVLFVIENNHYGLSTPAREQYACRDLADRGARLRHAGRRRRRQRPARGARARCGARPSARGAATGRRCSSSRRSACAATRRPRAPTTCRRSCSRSGRRRTPSRATRRFLVEQGLFDEARLRDDPRARYKLRDRRARRRGARARRSRGRRPRRSSPTSSRRASLVAGAPDDRGGGGRRPSCATSTRSATACASRMRRDERVVLLGQDIAEYGGVFKVTEGFVEEFGKARVRNTPIIESGAIGAALGLALDGFVPMVEMQFGDFITLRLQPDRQQPGEDALALGRRACRSCCARPIGGGTGAGPVPLAERRVVVHRAWRASRSWRRRRRTTPRACCSPRSRTATRSSTSSTSCSTARRRAACPPATTRCRSARRASRARASDATVVTYGVGVSWALEAAARARARGARDRGRRPALAHAVGRRGGACARSTKTGRCLVLHEAPLTGGFGGEVAATVGREAFEWLDAPVARLGALDTPVPFAKALEALYSPQGRLAAGAARAARVLARAQFAAARSAVGASSPAWRRRTRRCVCFSASTRSAYGRSVTSTRPTL